MRYALFICNDETADPALSPEEQSARLAEYGVFVEEMGRRGLLQGGERLRPTTDATTVRGRDGEVLTSHGPFAETKEQIGGGLLVPREELHEGPAGARRRPPAPRREPS